jgi:hypothetical protein
LHARKPVQLIALFALLLAISTPGVIDVWHRVPFFGLGSPAKAAAVAALFVSLLAGEALDAAPRVARRTAGLVFVALVSLTLVERTAAPKLVPDRTERFFAWTEVPPTAWTKGPATVAGYVTEELPCDLLDLRAQRVTQDGRASDGFHQDGPPYSSAMQIEPSSGGRRLFRSESLDVTEFAPGTWRFSIDVLRRRADGTLETIGSRDIAFSNIAPEPRMSVPSMAFTMLSFLSLLFVSGAPSRWKWAVVALAASQPLWMSRGLLPSVERGAGFDLSRTEQLVQEHIGAHRLVAGPGVFPGVTGLFQRIPVANAHTALESAATTKFWTRALKPGSDRAPAADETTVDTTSSAFRLLGVSMLADLDHADPPGFKLAAGLEGPILAEAVIHHALEPMPRAFCVTRIVDRIDLAARDPLSDPSFDPARAAFLDEKEGWRPASPASTTHVQLREHESDHVRLSATLDGDALLVLTDAASPGWIARVDGVARRIITVDGLFRGIPLVSGEHSIELEYAPASLRIGAWIALATLLTILVMLCVPRRRTADHQPA